MDIPYRIGFTTKETFKGFIMKINPLMNLSLS